MRRSTLILSLVLTPLAAAGDDLDILKTGPGGESPRTMLSTYLKSEARKAFETRRATVSSLKTPADVAHRQEGIRAKFIEALGGFPEKTPLRAHVIGSAVHKGYRLERVIYESRPSHHVTALFYLPEGTGPFPAVLIPCGHDANGKAAAPYQRACILLAHNGIASLCYDPISQGERRQLVDRDGRPIGAGNTTEHTLIGIGALLVGRSTASYRVWDGIRSLDYLASRPEIDASRLGCTGCSGGGTLTSYLMALDDRVAAAAPSCYITSLERLFDTIGPQDAEQNITGQVAFGMDHADYLGLRAPKPTLLLASTHDFFDIQGTWTTFREAKQLYSLLGHPERVDILEENTTHGYPKAHREAMAFWMQRWLLGKDERPLEDDYAIASDAELQCTKTGQVLSELHGKSVFDLNTEREVELARQRAEFIKSHSQAELLAEVRRLIGLRDPIMPAKREEHGVIQRPTFTAHKLIFTTEPGIRIPALLCTSEKVNYRGLTVVIGEDLPEALKPEGLAEFWISKNSPFLIMDLRGMGTTAPSATRPGPFGTDVKESFLSLHLARPLLGQRVGDLLSVLAALANDYPEDFFVTGHGAAGPIALHAAALNPKIGVLTLSHSLPSWSDVVRTPLSHDQLSNAVPGALAVYDLPDLAATLAPRGLSIGAPENAAGRPLSKEEIAVAYESTSRAYRGQNAANRLMLEPGLPRPTRKPLFRTVDLALGETTTVTLSDGKAATIKLVALDEQRDPIRLAVREVKVRIEVNGVPITLRSGNYQLPVTLAGVQVDCPITGSYRTNSSANHWALDKDARIRLWPAGSPWIEPTTFRHPVRQRWFASSTQMANEPVYVDGGEKPSVKKVYYHSGLDISGAEGLIDVVSATGGTVLCAGTAHVPWYESDDTDPVKAAYDGVHVLDDQGWIYSYEHLQSIDPAIRPGVSVKAGQKIGVLGKEGGSGGWSHLHFEIRSPQPSGRWGTQEGYAFLWQAFLREQKPDVVAVARPHRLGRAGDRVVLDGSKSWSRSGRMPEFQWTLSDGTTATGPHVERTYDRPGAYSEILKVSDTAGHVDYDFAIVQVLDRSDLEPVPPTIHATYAPTFGLKPGAPVTFKVRTFRTTDSQERWDFGDGTEPVDVHSDGNANPRSKDGYAVTTHRFAKPGHYLVSVSRTDHRGATATGRLHVIVGE